MANLVTRFHVVLVRLQKGTFSYSLFSKMSLARFTCCSSVADAINFQSVPELSKQQLQDLFATSIPTQWCTLVPQDNPESLICKPSNSREYYSINRGCEEDVKNYLKTSFDKIFTNRGHVETFWEDFALRVTHKLGLTYREVQRNNGTLASYSEARLQQCILNPILREISKAACIIPDTKHGTIKTDYLVEDVIEIEEGRAGRNPSVDAVIQVSNKHDQAVSYVPIEMKKEMDTSHYTQIACYMNKVSTAEGISDHIMVGILMDKKQFRLAFSVYCDDKIPLPVVHISPPIEWRSESSGSILEQSMLILACTFLVGQLSRIPYDTTKSHDIHKLPSLTLIKMGRTLFEKQYKLNKIKREKIASELVQKQQKEIDYLKEKVANLEKEIEERMPKQKKRKKLGI